MDLERLSGVRRGSHRVSVRFADPGPPRHGGGSAGDRADRRAHLEASIGPAVGQREVAGDERGGDDVAGLRRCRAHLPEELAVVPGVASEDEGVGGIAVGERRLERGHASKAAGGVLGAGTSTGRDHQVVGALVGDGGNQAPAERERLATVEHRRGQVVLVHHGVDELDRLFRLARERQEVPGVERRGDDHLRLRGAPEGDHREFVGVGLLRAVGGLGELEDNHRLLVRGGGRLGEGAAQVGDRRIPGTAAHRAGRAPEQDRDRLGTASGVDFEEVGAGQIEAARLGVQRPRAARVWSADRSGPGIESRIAARSNGCTNRSGRVGARIDSWVSNSAAIAAASAVRPAMAAARPKSTSSPSSAAAWARRTASGVSPARRVAVARTIDSGTSVRTRAGSAAAPSPVPCRVRTTSRRRNGLPPVTSAQATASSVDASPNASREDVRDRVQIERPDREQVHRHVLAPPAWREPTRRSDQEHPEALEPCSHELEHSKRRGRRSSGGHRRTDPSARSRRHPPPANRGHGRCRPRRPPPRPHRGRTPGLAPPRRSPRSPDHGRPPRAAGRPRRTEPPAPLPTRGPGARGSRASRAPSTVALSSAVFPMPAAPSNVTPRPACSVTAARCVASSRNSTSRPCNPAMPER